MTNLQGSGPDSPPKPPLRSGASWASLLAIALVCLTPLSFIVYSETSSHAYQKRANRSFTPVVATVVESGVARRGRRSGWFAKVTYRYEVDGHTYVSSRVSFAGTETSGLLRGGPSREDAAATVAEHPVGSAIDAYYDPTNPSEAVRDASPPSGSPLFKIVWFVVVAVLLGLLGVGVGARYERVRVSFPGPRIPERVITVVLSVACLASFAAGAWFMVRAARGSAQDDIGTAFAFVFIGAMILVGARLHRRRTGRGAA